MSATTLPKANGRIFHPVAERAPSATATRREPLPPIEDLAAMLAGEEDIPAEIVLGLLHQGAKMVIGGGSKTFKTWLLSDLALSVATGADWLGFPTSPGRVLYINLEIQRGFFRKRLMDIVQAKDITITSDLFDVWNLRGHAADLSLLIAEILAGVEQRYTLIIIDPIYKVLGDRDENAAGDIGSLLNELEKLAVKSKAAVVFGRTSAKATKPAKNPSTGSAAAGFTHVILTPSWC